MREVEYKNPLDVLVFKIFKMYHIFAESSSVYSEESTPLVLLLLSMFKDGLINTQGFYNPESLDTFRETIDAISKGKHKNIEYQPIIQILHQSLSKINNTSFGRTCETLEELDSTFLNENFASVFDDVLYRVSRSQGRYAGEFIQPVELTRLMIGLADIKKESKVFNPFAGLTSFGIYLDKDQNYFGQEFNQKTWALGALRLLAYERTGSTKYVFDDSVLHWPDATEKFDLIISNPPMGLKLDKYVKDVSRDISTIEHFLIEKGIQSLKPNGTLIALLPQSFLFKGKQEERLRKYLVDSDLIESVISLPGGLLFNTVIPLVILVITKQKRMPGKVRFIDGTKFYASNNQKEKVLDDQRLINLIRENQQKYISENSGIVNEPAAEYHSPGRKQNYVTDIERLVAINGIIVCDYNLNVPRYFQKHIEGVKLGDILDLVKSDKNNLPKKGKLILIRDLKNDPIDFILDVSNVEETEIKRSDVHLVSETCLLIATRWRTLKPTLFEFEGVPIFRGQDILSFKVNESKVDIAYLIDELHADYVLEQLESIRIGSIVPFIRIEDLLKVVIKLPSIVEQRRRINHIFQKTLVKEKNKIDLLRSIFNEELGVKQHNIRQHLKNVKDSLDTLMDFMKKKGGILNEEDVINPNRNVTVGKRFEKMYGSLENVIEEINTLTNEQSFNLSEPIDLLKLITSSVDEIIHPNFDVVLTKDEVSILGTELDKLIISFSKKELKELINNVVENAVRHGFTDKEKNYIIIFDISVDEENVILTIKNNGAPFPKNISSQIGMKGKKAGKYANQGIGAWKIVQAIEHFDHEYELIDEPESKFPVGWIFKFKLITE